MSGSFWKFSNGFTSLSNISTLLENHSINQDHNEASYESTYDVLLKLLDENDLLQELLSNNPMLLEFLREDVVLAMLVDLVINEGDIKKIKQENTEDTNTTNTSTDNTTINTSSDTTSDTTSTSGSSSPKDKDTSDTSIDEITQDDPDSTNEPEDDEESAEEKATRRATIAAEILSADVWSLTDTVMDSTPNLNKLWSILDSKTPLSINLSTYFMKIMEHLLDMKCDEMISYLIENQTNLVDKFMNHLSNSPLMDFLLKLISTDKPDNSTGIIDFLQNQNLISHLINALNIPEDSDNIDELLVKQSSAADFLKALITISANSTTDNSTIGPSELTRELVSYEQMSILCDLMLKGGYALANGVGIIIEIIRKNNSDYDILPVLYITLETHPPTGRDPIYLGHLLKVFGSKIDDFNRLLVNEERDANKLQTPFGEIEPLGFERFKICELIAELLHCSNMALLNDNKGYEVVKERDELRQKMKEYDPISFKYNEVIVLPSEEKESSNTESSTTSPNNFDDTIDSFNGKSQFEDADDSFGSKLTHQERDDIDDQNVLEENEEDHEDSFTSKLHDDSIVNNQDDDEEEPHANANLTEEQLRANPVVGDFLKISLFDTQIITNILSMFFKFPWNNFLHNVVFDIVQQVLNGSMGIGFNKFLAIDLFHLGDITNKIIEGQKLCSDYEETHNGLRLGFMGHLTLIAEEVVKFIQLYPTNSLSELIDNKVEDEVWEHYVSHVLYDTREKYNAILGGGEEDDEDEDEDNENHTFDEDLGEIIEEVKTGLVFDPNTDHDIRGSGYEEKEENEEHEEHEDAEDKEEEAEGKYRDRLDSDESESDDDDHFTNYMSQQLIPEAKPARPDNNELPGPDFEDNEDYIDPNDDGMSYKKPSPIYDASGSLLNSIENEEDDLSEDSSSSSSDSEENADGELGEGDTKLTRAASKG